MRSSICLLERKVSLYFPIHIPFFLSSRTHQHNKQPRTDLLFIFRLASCFPLTVALPDEPPFTYTPLETIGTSLLRAIKGDYLLPHDQDDDDFDGYINGQKWDVLDLDPGFDQMGLAGDLEDKEEGEDQAGRKVSANGMRIVGKPSQGIAIHANRIRS
jgi:hypothetical protein